MSEVDKPLIIMQRSQCIHHQYAATTKHCLIVMMMNDLSFLCRKKQSVKLTSTGTGSVLQSAHLLARALSFEIKLINRLHWFC